MIKNPLILKKKLLKYNIKISFILIVTFIEFVLILNDINTDSSFNLNSKLS